MKRETEEKPMGVEEAATRIISELRALADPRKADSAQRFVAEPIQALGIDAPTLRGLARAWILRLKPSWRLGHACALCDLLFQQPDIETRAAGFLALGGFAREYDRGMIVRAERWLDRYLDNWGLVDGFASTVLSPLLRLRPECSAELRRWTRSECLWTRRAAVVTLVPFARRGERLEFAFELAEALLGEKEDLMHKAVGWLLREAGKTDPARLEAFLLRHRGGIPRTTVRHAIERFPDGERKRLLEETRREATVNSVATAPTTVGSKASWPWISEPDR
jgi:3-methyladenine DNA glycosylase AlkD